MRQNLDDLKGEIALNLDPLFSKDVDPKRARTIKTVFSVTNDALRLPESALSFPWTFAWRALPCHAMTAEHIQLISTCKEAYRFVAILVDNKLWPPDGKLCLHEIFPDHSIPGYEHSTFINLKINGEPTFFIDQQTSFSALNVCWKAFPFASDELCRTFSAMPEASQNVLNRASAVFWDTLCHVLIL